MKIVLLSVCCALAVIASSQVSDELTAFVPSDLPVYVNGQRVNPRGGGHTVAVSREKGLTIDGVLYLPLWTAPPYIPAVRSDGMHYANVGAKLAASAVLEGGGSRETARQAMLDFWRREFGDSLTVASQGQWEFKLTYRGQTLGGVKVITEGYHPDRQEPDNFAVLQSSYREAIYYIEQGYLLVCGQGYFNPIKPDDADAAIKSLGLVASRARRAHSVNGRTIYETQFLVDGKYGLTNSAVADFVAQAHEGR